MIHAFTNEYDGRARVLHTTVVVNLPIVTGNSIDESKSREYLAIWDTGATHSAITKKVIDDLDLKATGIAEVRHAKGKEQTNTYLVSIALQNKVRFEQLRVTEVDLIPDDNQKDDKQPQLLIGMDIIAIGDFAVTCHNGKTVMSFRLPSQERIDFVPNAKLHNVLEMKKAKQPFKGFNKRKR